MKTSKFSSLEINPLYGKRDFDILYVCLYLLLTDTVSLHHIIFAAPDFRC